MKYIAIPFYRVLLSLIFGKGPVCRICKQVLSPFYKRKLLYSASNACK
ncbi:hypothetical protein HMPREF6123_0352 [Oribacterium sinus F0268]|uniref:Uncharacterized protein n=1 Tax=Oribacterium sinus F0268 TaxID=585501 RepID=C2KV33_9FIRM|nr:hypothetical protein HMPREF6123_0352 [Oribacterium sinus F0268]